ncbi:hypothetical protein BDM02DRAFT_1766962 [Thelephora ganbajun]|uniref:Uncharacterized protein n=1 Tax=Thelephora ganbajun TaxID=370292 RepID=A0ACB6ZK65_THEGA|nr:hypothetical protein BDM02DRAFT_1766962 [Thelephora ganbajun]
MAVPFLSLLPGSPMYQRLEIQTSGKVCDTKATLMYLAWYTFCAVLWVVLPGDWVEGLPMRNSHQWMEHKINAFPTFFLSLGITPSITLCCGPQLVNFTDNNGLNS